MRGRERVILVLFTTIMAVSVITAVRSLLIGSWLNVAFGLFIAGFCFFRVRQMFDGANKS